MNECNPRNDTVSLSTGFWLPPSALVCPLCYPTPLVLVADTQSWEVPARCLCWAQVALCDPKTETTALPHNSHIPQMQPPGNTYPFPKIQSCSSSAQNGFDSSLFTQSSSRVSSCMKPSWPGLPVASRLRIQALIPGVLVDRLRSWSP